MSNFPKVDQICQSIKDKYEYGNESYAVVAPNGVLDIIVEGDFLNHCLRGSDRYWDRIQTYESYILFLRRASAVDIPYLDGYLLSVYLIALFVEFLRHFTEPSVCPGAGLFRGRKDLGIESGGCLYTYGAGVNVWKLGCLIFG